MFEAIDQWLDAVPTLFHAPVAVALNGVFQFELAGMAPFHITITPAAAVVARGPSSEATMIVSTTAQSWLDVVNGGGNARLRELVDSQAVTLVPFDHELLKWVELVLRSDRSQSETDFRKILAGSVEVFTSMRGMWLPFLRGQGLLRSHHLLDLGCGTLRVGIPLIEYLDRGHYVGVDLRAEVFPEARREVEANGLTAKEPVLLHTPDPHLLDLGRRFDAVLAGSVLVNLEDAPLGVLLASVNRHLAPTGSFYANANILEHLAHYNEKLRWLGNPWVARSLEFYREAGRAHGLELTDLGFPSSDIPSIRTQRIIRYQLTP